MTLDILLPNLIFILLLTIAISTFAYSAIKNGGFKSAFFGSKIKRQIGEVEATNVLMGIRVHVKMRVHLLDNASPSKAIGLERVEKTILSYRMSPMTLSIDETQNLISLLQEAVTSFKDK